MATRGKNLSHYHLAAVPDASPFRFGLIVSGWNAAVTEALCEGARETLVTCGALPENILRRDVPGSFELVYGAKKILLTERVNAVITIGSIIRGETYHFEVISNAVAQGIAHLNVVFDVPVIFCVLTDNTLRQATDRSGGKYGNKGAEAAVTAIKMAALARG